MEVRHINRSSSATYHPKVYTGTIVHLTQIGDTLGIGPLAQTLVGSLTSETAVGTIEVVEMLPLLESLVEELGVIDHDAIELSVELLIIDAV